MTAAPQIDAIQTLLEEVARLDAAHVVDIGCGAGLLAKRLIKAGARVAGVDPDERALAAARIAAPSAVFSRAGAERLPFPDRAFDFAVFLNSLHHVPSGAMDDALTEAQRVLGDDGQLYVIEPRASGSLFETLKIIDDETVVRRQAQEAIERLLSRGAMRVKQSLSYDRQERFADLDQFIDRIAAVEPGRRQAADARKAEFAQLFLHHALPSDDGGYWLFQPMTAWVLTKSAEDRAK
jgi:ubiquinone/menaquinone biosynthesis C-methylase UbiE